MAIYCVFCRNNANNWQFSVYFVVIYAFFRCKLYSQKFCLCKKNDKYQVCIYPQTSLWFGEKAAFLTQKTWFHAIPWLFSFPTIFICKNEQNITLQLRRNRFSFSNTQKHAQNWLLWAFPHFFCFWDTFFENFEPTICFFVHQIWDEIIYNHNLVSVSKSPGGRIYRGSWPANNSNQWRARNASQLSPTDEGEDNYL